MENTDSYNYCELCDITTTSHQQLQAHMCGRSHMDMVQRSDVTQRWVYVHGFSEVSSTEDDLRKVMSQFGGVVSVMIKTTINDHCYGLVEFNSSEAALNSLKHSSPIILNTHTLTIKPRTLHTLTKHKRGGRLGRKKCVNITTATADYTDKEVKVAGEMIGGIRLSPEALVAISSANCVNKGLEAIALHCRLSNTVAEQQLELAWQLQNMFRIYMPLCMVIPFGAPFSGHGTVSSDCDLCLLSNPNSLDISLFSGSNYLPSHLHGFWEHLQTTPVPLTEVGVAERGVVNELGFDDVMGIIKSDKYCSNVLAIRNARCPIIRFIYDPHQLHCDLSINNRLGPANTRLLAAYMNFDPRMSVLVPCVRLWARGCGLKRSQINNYGLSLLLIHSLQHSMSPPVLPCLQEPGIWPKDMSWIASKGLKQEEEEEEQIMMVDKWNCSFINPHTLLPSTNTSSSAQLLLHFFNYFLVKFSFSVNIVTIHTLSHLCLPYRGTGFKVSSVCVQDPFEQSHNVTKTMKIVHLNHMLQVMRSSQQTLKQLLNNEQQQTPVVPRPHDILSLFRPSEMPATPNRANDEHLIELDISTASHLLHDTQYTALEGRLEELDLTNLIIQHKLCYILVSSLAYHLEKEFDFEFRSIQDEETCDMTSSSVSIAGDNVSCSTQSRKRCRALEEEDEMMDVEDRSDEGIIKRQRITGHAESSAEQVLFSLTEGQRSDCRLECIAYEASWIDRRRKRRHPQTQSTQHKELKPCLSFILSANINQHRMRGDGSLATFRLQLTDLNFQSAFHQFFAVCKKLLF